MSIPYIGLDDLRQRPHDVANAISTNVALTTVTVVRHDRAITVLEAEFGPTLELEANGYPTEVARIGQYTDERHPEPYVHPIGPDRSWEHRYGLDPASGCYEQLCLCSGGASRRCRAARRSYALIVVGRVSTSAV